MTITVPVQQPTASQRHTGFGIPFRIQLDQFKVSGGNEHDKRDIVLLAHFMGDCQEKFVIYRSDLQGMVRVGILSL